MAEHNNLKDLRKNYELHQLLEVNIDNSPFVQFQNWFNLVLKEKILEPNAMTLATASKSGIPSARVVLLKGFDETGFTFFTNYRSRKGKELSKNPFAAVVFNWMQLERQVRIEGKVKKISREVSQEYFDVRPLKSRYGALASNQSEVISGRDLLENKFAELESKFGENPPMPENWGGYKLIPTKFEFWQGRQDRLHDRICYERDNNDWRIYRLSP
jgi:pyridoxamine 5'-phosphate oxidase